MSYLSLQPYYKLTINGIDVTDAIEDDVVYDEKEDLLTELIFTLSKGIYFLDTLKIGDKVEFLGGTLDPNNQRIFFKGSIKFIRSRFPDDGVVRAIIICIGGNWSKSASSNASFVYPSTKCKRGWADIASLTSQEIVRNIVTKEMGLNFGTITINGAQKEALIITAKVKFTKTKPIKQHYKTDWAFLIDFSRRLNCTLWVEYNSVTDAEEIFFVDEDLVRDISSDLSFVYPGRDAEAFLIDGLQPNQLLARSLSVDEDSDAASGIIRSITKFDPETGDQVNLFVEYDEEHKKLYYYELDEAKVAALDAAEQDRLWNMGAFTIDFETAIQYYKRTEYKPSLGSKDFGTIGRPFVGIRLSLEVDGNVNLVSKKSYPITGISNRYSTRGSSTQWYMLSIQHIWGGRGYICVANFYR